MLRAADSLLAGMWIAVAAVGSPYGVEHHGTYPLGDGIAASGDKLHQS